MSAIRPRPLRTPVPARRQRGIALLISLLLLAVMMVVGSNAMELAIVEYRVGAGMRDRAATFEGTESAGLQSFARLRSMIATGSGSCDNTNGRYEGGRLPTGSEGTPTDSDAVSPRFWATYGMPASYAVSTDLVSSMANVTGARYLIECLPIDDEGEPASAATYPLLYYRMTVFGGGDASAEVLLQSTLVTLPK